jgi:hypothetical protein
MVKNTRILKTVLCIFMCEKDESSNTVAGTVCRVDMDISFAEFSLEQLVK